MVATKSAVHEIEAGLCFLIVTVAIGCAAIVEELKKGKDKSTPVVPVTPGRSAANTGGGPIN